MFRRPLLCLTALAFVAPAYAQSAPTPVATTPPVAATPAPQTTAEAQKGTKVLRTNAGHAGCSWGSYTPTS